jgi:hypothetical protein
MDSSGTTRAAVAGIGMAFLSLVLLFLGQDLFGWAGVLLAALILLVLVRALQAPIVRWIRGSAP